ncbi:MAG: tungstate ABC transporter substrate-binding protein WtpA [Dehalococcoidales bacterium]|nr:tungstate ABC transporter substrate-binding protein WtpA [Dehalococcoidales bacterium]
MKRLLWGVLVSILAIALVFTGCSGTENRKTTVIVYEAGSLMVPFTEIEKAFELKYPSIDVLMEGHGSIQVVRHVTEIHDEVDIAAVADSTLIPLLMYPTQTSEGNPYADWTISFATNRLGIAYTPQSKYINELNDRNWYDILSREDVRLGFADPRLDAVGYRALMLTQLAELYYKDTGIFEHLLGRQLSPSITSLGQDGVYNIKIPELLEPKSEHLFLRGFSIQLLSLLESREIDYAFEYESVAKQHNLEFLPLPPQIDLSVEEYLDIYQQVRVSLDFKRFATVTPVFTGYPIVYGITIPTDAKHKKEAILFLTFLLGPEGQEIMKRNYHPPLSPAMVDNKDKLPPELQKLVK